MMRKTTLGFKLVFIDFVVYIYIFFILYLYFIYFMKKSNQHEFGTLFYFWVPPILVSMFCVVSLICEVGAKLRNRNPWKFH